MKKDLRAQFEQTATESDREAVRIMTEQEISLFENDAVGASVILMHSIEHAMRASVGKSFNPNVLKVHNLMKVQSKAGWKEADLIKAMTDASNGIRY